VNSLARSKGPRHQQTKEAQEKMTRQQRAEQLFAVRTNLYYSAFCDCYNLVRKRALGAAERLRTSDRQRQLSSGLNKSRGGLLRLCFRSRMATQIVRHREWEPSDCGRWLAALGADQREVEEILLEVAKRQARAQLARGNVLVIWPGRGKLRKLNRSPQKK
jgi:hypothetical protein